MTISTAGSDVAVHPGEVLAEELEARGMAQRTLAAEMGRSPQVVNGIVRGKKSITAETALGLERALGIPARVWLNLQVEYELVRARTQQRKGAWQKDLLTTDAAQGEVEEGREPGPIF